jgi:hypothetical protein
LQDFEEALRRPALAQEEVLHAGAVAALAQPLLLAEDLDNAAHHGTAWSSLNKCVEFDRQMRVGGKAAAHAHGIADFFAAPDGGQGDVVDLRIGAPDRAAGDGDLELARQIVELELPLTSRATARARGEASISSCASTPATGQPVTLRTTSPQAPRGESPTESSASTAAGRDSTVSQCNWIAWRVVISARLRA